MFKSEKWCSNHDFLNLNIISLNQILKSNNLFDLKNFLEIFSLFSLIAHRAFLFSCDCDAHIDYIRDHMGLLFNINSERQFLLEKFSWQRYSRLFALPAERSYEFEKFYGSVWNRTRNLWQQSHIPLTLYQRKFL